MPRQANAIDFWRGIALITIFINHVPGIYYARFTHANYSLSDSADLFVFLAGWSLRLHGRHRPSRLQRRPGIWCCGSAAARWNSMPRRS